MGIKVLFIYPNTYGMNMIPSGIALFSALLKNKGHKTEIFDLSELAENIISKYENSGISKDFNKKIYFNGRKNLIQRCISNLIDNSIKLLMNNVKTSQPDEANDISEKQEAEKFNKGTLSPDLNSMYDKLDEFNQKYSDFK